MEETLIIKFSQEEIKEIIDAYVENIAAERKYSVMFSKGNEDYDETYYYENGIFDLEYHCQKKE